MRDAHKILSVGRNATMQDIKVAYRRLALQLHPDTNGGDDAKSERFKQVNDAYSYLTDPKAKEQDLFDDFQEQYATYSSRPKYTQHSANSHWNPFQSPFQNMKNAQKAKNKRNTNPFGDFEEWDSFDFIDFDTGEDIVFSFDKKGKAKTSRKKKNAHNKKEKKKTQSPQGGDDPFAEFTTAEIEDIIRNSTSGGGTHPSWGSAESFPSSSSHVGGGSPDRRRRSNSNSSNSSNSNSSNKKKSNQNYNNKGSNGNSGHGNGNSGGGKKASRSRRRRRGGGEDDCTIC